MELRQLKTFVTIVNAASFTKAATELGYAQSTITSHIQLLEEEFGILLFERLGKRLKLTDYGDKLYLYAKQILNLADEAKETIPNFQTLKGSIIIATAESLCTHRLPPILKAFRSRYPHIEINIRFDVGSNYRTSLKKNIVDIVFFLDAPCTDGDLIVHSIFAEPMSVIASPNHPLTKKNQVFPQDINGQSLILTQETCSYRCIFESILTQAGAKPSAVLGLGSNEVIKKFVRDDWGLGFLPYIAVQQELSDNLLVALPWCGPPFPISAQLIYHKDKWLSPVLRTFISFFLEYCKQPV
ncbi:MAG: gltC 1 [Firmicutes bacterium]|nr:gltC 1 [Bacillota bacterium]